MQDKAKLFLLIVGWHFHGLHLEHPFSLKTSDMYDGQKISPAVETAGLNVMVLIKDLKILFILNCITLIYFCNRF